MATSGLSESVFNSDLPPSDFLDCCTSGNVSHPVVPKSDELEPVSYKFSIGEKDWTATDFLIDDPAEAENVFADMLDQLAQGEILSVMVKRA